MKGEETIRVLFFEQEELLGYRD